MHLMRLYRAFKRYIYLQLKYRWLDLRLRGKEEAAFVSGTVEEIGFVDQDGLIHCGSKHRHLFHHVNVYRSGEYLHRHKFSIRIVRISDTLLIEKNYRGNLFSFYNELSVLEKLNGLDCIPAVHSISYKDKIIWVWKYPTISVRS
jgi:hypothetical protein